MLDASSDLSRSLWQLSKRPPSGSREAEQPEISENFSSVTDYYIESAPGVFVEAGPPTPDPGLPNRNETTYVGGSSDLSHLLFSTRPGFHWPFDKTASNSSPLYEYVGTENGKPPVKPPMLVGVDGGRDSHELLSECGIRLGSSEPSSELTGHGSMYNAISNDGRRVFFTAVGTDDRACGGGEPPVDELFVREELSSGEMYTAAISEPSIFHCSPAPPPSCADATFEGASRDGSTVYFASSQRLLPGVSEGSTNLYEDELTGSGLTLTQRLVLVSGGSATPGVQGVARVSEDGSSVYFVATGELTETANTQGYHAEAGENNLYLFERNESHPDGHTTFVATLSPGDEGVWRREDSRPVLLSSNDRFLVFPSGADLTHEGAHGIQIYQYDSQTGILARASIGQGGYNNDGKTPVSGSRVTNGSPIGYSYSRDDSPTQAAGVLAPMDGAVFFESADALTPYALNDQSDELGEPTPNIYEYRNGSVYLISDGRDVSVVTSAPSVQLIGSSASGGDLFFGTADSLVAQDTDAQQDIYDAHVEGGFSPPAKMRACEEEACRGALSQAPPLGEALAPPVPEAAQPTIGKLTKTKKTKTRAGHRSGKKHGKRGKRARKATSHHAHVRAGVGRS